MKNLISILCMGLSMLSVGLYGKNGVSGDLRWVGTRPSTDCPVSLGIPFLKGELEADGRVVLKDGGGSGIPSDCWPLAYWPDGSVKWLGVAAVIPGEVEGIRFETVGKKHKMKNRSETKIQVDETTSFLRVSTGKVEAYIPKRGSCLLDSLRCEGRTVGGQAALLCSTQDHPSAGGEAVLHYRLSRTSGTRHGGTCGGCPGIGADRRPLCERCHGTKMASVHRTLLFLCRERTNQDGTFLCVRRRYGP